MALNDLKILFLFVISVNFKESKIHKFTNYYVKYS